MVTMGTVLIKVLHNRTAGLVLFQEEEPPVEEKVEEIIPEQPFQEVFVTCPDGLQVRYFLQSSVGKPCVYL